ncbi:MAG: hypothetical protein JWN95_3823 [Frankiales bacterium]|nr:hypothetical protein [Frankiales bacterium]
MLASAGELVGDKQPNTPSRLEPAGFASRIAFGALCGGVVVHRAGRSVAPTALGALLGAAGATAGAQAGATWRQIASRKFGPDLPGALLEDAVAILTATAAVKL